MAITVTRARVKEKCGITDSGADAAIDALIVEMVPVVELLVRAEHLASLDPGVVATLALAAHEVVAGETLAQLSRPGGTGEIRLHGLSLSFGGLDPSGLIRQGLARLEPFRREASVYESASSVSFDLPSEAEES